MSDFKFNNEMFEDILEEALFDSVLFLQDKITDITPRDPNRLPENPNAKVTWNLKRSVTVNKQWPLKYAIWVAQNEAEYWFYLEFWTKKMWARSFLRKWLFDNKVEAMEIFANTSRKSLN